MRVSWIFLMAMFLALAAPGETRAAAAEKEQVRINSVVVEPASSIAAAEAKAKRVALANVVKMRGNQQLRAADVDKIMANADSFVETRLVLNKEPVGGLYQPAFYFNVRMENLNEIIVASNEEVAVSYDIPRMQVAIVIRRLPKEFAGQDDRESYIDDLNETVKEYYGRAGFSLVDYLNFDEEMMYEIKKLRQLEKVALSPENPPTSVDYYLLGQLDVPQGNIKARDGGAYYKANVKLQIKLLDLNSGQPVSASRTVEGTGESARESLDDALRNVVKHIQQKANAPDILKTWRRNIRTGMKYDIAFCEKDMKHAYFDDLTKGLEAYGGVSGAKSAEIPLHVFTFAGGAALDPAKEFERMLADIQGRTGKFADTAMKPVIFKKHKVFLFGNSPECFGGARVQAVQ